MRRLFLAVTALAAALFVITGCAGTSSSNGLTRASQEANRLAQARDPYVPKNDVEYNNFNNAQKLYDSPSTIIWCTTTWGNPSAPLVTIPIAGKLTSSTTSVLPPDYVDTKSGSQTDVDRPRASVDGLFHPNPPPYRYGFTPGGQYFDFFQMPTLCTTAVTKFQRQQTKVSLTIDPGAETATRRAEAVLQASIDPKTHEVTPQAQAAAQRILEGAGLGG